MTSKATTKTPDAIAVHIMPASDAAPTGKLAEAELHFHTGPLAGLRLVGFTVWSDRQGDRQRVSFPARSYSVNGERRHYALLRPTEDATARQAVEALILAAYADRVDAS